MQNQVDLAPDTRALFNQAFKIGRQLDRKFEASDLTPVLRQAARQYAAEYSGDFPFMIEMRNQVIGGLGGFLSDGQAKGVLNVLMADARRRLQQRQPAATVSTPPAHQYLTSVPDGRYRVTLVDGDHLAIRIEHAGKDSKLAGARIISTRIGDEWLGRGHVGQDGSLRIWRSTTGDLRGRVENAIEILDSADKDAEQGWLISGLAFAQEGSQCFFCGRDLDTPESLLVGYGPTCADKHGLPWGAKAIPMSVRLAQAAAAQTEQAGEVASPAPAPTPAAPPVAAAPAPVTVPQEAPRTNQWQSPVSLSEARARGQKRTYEDIFGEDEETY